MMGGKVALSGERETERTAESAEAERKGDADKQGGAASAGRAKRKLSGSMAAKVTAFLFFIISMAMGMGCVVPYLYLFGGSVDVSENVGGWILYNEDAISKWIGGFVADIVKGYLEEHDLQGAKNYCNAFGAKVEVRWYDRWKDEETLLWTNYEGNIKEGSYVLERVVSKLDHLKEPYACNYHPLRTYEDYIFYVYLDLESTGHRLTSIYKSGYLMAGTLEDKLLADIYSERDDLAVKAVVYLFAAFVCFIFLMCSAGHRNGVDGIAQGVLTSWYLDVMTVFFAIGAALIRHYVSRIANDSNFLFVYPVGITLLASWLTLYLMDFAIRVKRGQVLRRTLIYVSIQKARRGIAWARKTVRMVTTATVGVLIVVALETAAVYLLVRFAGDVRFADSRYSTVFWIFWVLEKLILLGVVVYMASAGKTLIAAGKALAEGEEDFRVDTAGMGGVFKEHGENLNSLGQGISRAVAERVKSEHLKTELITNVSHDIKTPLTSIINYAGLICEEKSENAKISEYAEVLFRQSGRLKKLLEDLMEASKATTGNIEVKMEPCEVGVLLSQAVGEYQQRMEEKGLELIAKQPEEPVSIMADGRLLWRVFENLLNNICKYSQENSRVYLSVEVKEGRAFIIFRNMSKYALDIQPDELMERFVRGDKSRHMEGNGLGLSIARSLVELQNAKMEIVIDGDLFKVILSFAVISGTPIPAESDS